MTSGSPPAATRSVGATFVTNNEREFGWIPELLTENWLSKSADEADSHPVPAEKMGFGLGDAAPTTESTKT